MVMEYGMSDKLGPVTLGHKQEQVFLGRDFVAEPNYSDEVAYLIDQEVHRLVDEAHQEAERILTEERERLDVIAEILKNKETVDKQELLKLLEGEPQEVYRSFLDEKEKEKREERLGTAPEREERKPRGRKTRRPGASPKPEVQPE
jgi:glucosamine 6-phosphate synthetase-like amidotransferase/phosphosugar isomerase protein